MAVDHAGGREWRRWSSSRRRPSRKAGACRAGARHATDRHADDYPGAPMKMLFFCAAISACAQSGLDRPRIGTMLDRNGNARPVLGFSGSITVADPIATKLTSLACAQSCLYTPAPGGWPAGPALFAFDTTGAFVYFLESRLLARWQSGELTPLDY